MQSHCRKNTASYCCIQFQNSINPMITIIMKINWKSYPFEHTHLPETNRGKTGGCQHNGTHERTKHQIRWKIMEMKLTHITMIIKNSAEIKIIAGEKGLCIYEWTQPKKKKNAYATHNCNHQRKDLKRTIRKFRIFRFNTCYGLYIISHFHSLSCCLCSLPGSVPMCFTTILQSLLLLLSLFYYRNRASDECKGGKLLENTI